jgi:hypothetical protein
MRIVKGVRITDNRGTEVTVDGVVSDDNKYVAAAVARSFVTPWKKSSTGSGNDTRAIGFGDIHIFRAEKVEELSDGTCTADLDQIIGPLQIRVNEIDKGALGKSVSINSFLDDKYGMGENAKPYSKLMHNTSLKSAILHAIAIAGENIDSKEFVSRNSILAAASKKFSEQAYKQESKVTQKPAKEKEVPNQGISEESADSNIPF